MSECTSARGATESGVGPGACRTHDLGRLAMTGGSDPDCVSESVDLVVCVVICESASRVLRLSDCLLTFVERLKAIFSAQHTIQPP